MPELPSDPPESPTSPTVIPVTEGSGLPRNVAAGLACIFPLFGGIAFLFIDRKDPFVRIYALQSIVLGLALLGISLMNDMAHFMFSHIPLLGGMFNWVLALIFAFIGCAWAAVWIGLTGLAFWNKDWKVPYLRATAEKLKMPKRFPFF